MASTTGSSEPGDRAKTFRSDATIWIVSCFIQSTTSPSIESQKAATLLSSCISTKRSGPSSHQDDYKQAKRLAMRTGKSLIEMSRSSHSCLKNISLFTVSQYGQEHFRPSRQNRQRPQDKYGHIDLETTAQPVRGIHLISRQRRTHENHHWKPQSDALLMPVSQFQSICRLEHLSDELPRALADTGLNLPSPERWQTPPN